MVIQLSEDVSAKGLVLLLFAESLLVGFFFLGSEGVKRLDGVCKFLSYRHLISSWFSRVGVADFTRVLSAISFREINIAVAAQFATQSGD